MEYIYKATKFKHNIDKNINTATDTLQELFIELNELDEDEAFEIELEERFAGKN